MSKDNLVDLVSEICKIDKQKVFKRDRFKDVVLSRHVVCYFARNYLMMKLDEIGKWLNIHHSSVIHGINKVGTLIEIGDEMYVDVVKQTNYMIGEKYEQDVRLVMIVPFHVNIVDMAKDLQERYNCKLKRLVE